MGQFVLVWVLVFSGYGHYNSVTYSPPVKTLEDCERLQKAIAHGNKKGGCVQVNMMVVK